MVRILSTLAALSALCGAVLSQASNDDPRGKELYVNFPSCSYYRCEVIWHTNESVYVNWLNAPRGGLRIQLAPQDGTTGLQTYTITDNVGSIHGFKNKHCNDMGTGEKCGRFDWIVPASVKEGKYQVEVTSLSRPDLVGYTDTVVIKKAGKSGKKGKRHAVERLEDDEE